MKPCQWFGQSILVSVIDVLEELQVWVLGHMRVMGSKEAEKVTKEVAKSREKGTNCKDMKSIRDQSIK